MRTLDGRQSQTSCPCSRSTSLADSRDPTGAPLPHRFGDSRLPPLRHLGRWGRLPPVWAEGRSALEYARLRRDPIFSGQGVPPGGGRTLLLVPGFLVGDSSLHVMRDWLIRCGYRAELPGIALNLRYSEIVLRPLAARLLTLAAWAGRGKVTLIGHSRGGLLAKVLADRHPQLVQAVVCLGSPLNDPYDIHPLSMAGVRLAHAYNLLRYARGAKIETPFLRDLEAPPRVPLFSLFSRSDGIVHWEACLRPDAECLEVGGSHLGLGVNQEVYRTIAALLVPSAGPPPGSPSAAG